MNNTIMTAKNTFAEGLVMDFAPDNTLANTLTSALNATLLTFNGNEMSLQNDMGNGRVETARLPDGYIPLGTCEFGDIIYIVSYNPITNKSLIGCFPSPERNISSDEIVDTHLTLSYLDFQYTDGLKLTGFIKNMQVKKVLIGALNLNPGDKFVIYSNDSIDKLGISNYGNTLHTLTDWPKLVKLHVVSLDESNKITYLDLDMKWYTNQSGDFYLKDLVKNNSETLKPDLDAYQNLISSAYSIFQSKNSGKLAILAELESIQGFNCAYSVITDKKTEETVDYNIYLHASWLTDHNDVNPVGIAILDSKWINNKASYITYKINNGVASKQENFAELPISQTGPAVYKEFSRIYYQESNGTYLEYVSGNIDNHKTSYNYFINSEHNNPYVGWGDMASSNLRSVTRITLKKINGKYVRTNNKGVYYFNLDKFENGEGKTKGLDNIYYNTKETQVSDDVVNNYFKKDITIDLATLANIITHLLVDGLVVETDLSNLVWKFKVAPCMPYGVLDLYAIDLVIDFSKVGKNIINLTNWKYFNSGDIATLTYGFDINLDDTQKIKEITFDFYDNQGIAATYHSTNKTSYSGVFTELLGLNGTNTNYKLNNVSSFDSSSIIYHAGQKYSEDIVDPLTNLVYWDGQNLPRAYQKNDDLSKVYINDGGSLYSNILYKVLITVHYGIVNELNDFIDIKTKRYSRWIWTNHIYNDYYYTTNDFDELPISLDLACTYQINSTDLYKLQSYQYYNNKLGGNIDNPRLDSLGALVTYINLDSTQDGNLKLSLDVGVKDAYNTLYLSNDSNKLNNLKIKIALGRSEISTTSYKLTSENGDLVNDTLVPILDNNINKSNGSISKIGNKLSQELKGHSTINPDIWESANAYESYYDTFNMNFSSSESYLISSEEYYDPITMQTYNKQLELSTNYTESKLGVYLTLTGILFNKLCYNNTNIISGTYPVVRSLARSLYTRDLLNISYGPNGFYFNKVLSLNTGGGGGAGGINIRHFSAINKSTVTGDALEIGNSSVLSATSERIVTGVDKIGITSPIVLCNWGDFKDNLRLHWRNIKNFNIPMNGHRSDRLHVDAKIGDDLDVFHLFQLALNNPKLGFYMFNDCTSVGLHGGPQIPMDLKCSTASNFQYKKDSNANYINNKIKNSYLSELAIANLVINMFSDIYYQSADYENYEGIKLDNLSYAESLNELWSKHIIITLLAPLSYDNSYIIFNNGVSLKDYINAVNNHFYSKLDVITSKNNNINVKLSDSTQIIDFQYSIPNSEELKTTYLSINKDLKTLIYYSDLETPIPSNKSFDSELYWNNKGKLEVLNKDFYYTLKNWKWLGDIDASDLLVASNKSNDLIKVPNLGRIISYDKNNLFKVTNYPLSNILSFGSAQNDSHCSYYNFSLEASFTGLSLGFSN